ncbi:MAG: protease pro-enzyme activation domain-containing protein [Polyangiaceae bacterium]
MSNGQAVLAGSLPADQNLHVTLSLSPRNQAELTSLLSQLYDPSSPKYRQFLSVEQFTEQFGPTAEDFQTVMSFARANGIAVTDTPANRLIVPLNGTVAQIEKAFNVKMNAYQHPTENRTFFAPDREPSLNLSVPVTHISGLDNYNIPHRAATAPYTASGPYGTYLGSNIRNAYYENSSTTPPTPLTALTGAGQIVGLLEFEGYNLSDVNESFSSAGQTSRVPVVSVVLDGANPGVGSGGSDGEVILDIVAAIGMAPGLSQVRVYVGASDVDIFNKMATEKPENMAKQISVSWTEGDNSVADDPVFQEMATQGQSIFVASGDWGSYPDGHDTPFPAEDAWVTAVGGTELPAYVSPWSEVAWGLGYSASVAGAASGGGISPDSIPIPSWQVGVANSLNGASTTLRNLPDVAAISEPGMYLCSDGGCGPGPGTSLASPLWAGFMALVNQQAVETGNAPKGGLGFINPAIYAIGENPAKYAADFHDMIGGTNGAFNAVKGYDLVTGWGSPNGQNLINDLIGVASSGFTLTNAAITTGLTIHPGGSGTVAIYVNDTDGFTGSVTLAASGLPSGVTASFGSNPTKGTSVLTLTASSEAVAGTYPVTITGLSTTSTTARTAIPLTVASGGSFSLKPSAPTLAVGQGSTATDTITVTDVNGFAGNVTLSVSGLPNGVTVKYGTNPTESTSVLAFTASSTATAGTVTVTVTGISGSLSATAAIALDVIPGSSGTSCTIDYTISPQNSSSFGATITINNTGTTALTSWSLTWIFANGQTITSLWNGVETQSGANVTVTNEAYNGSIPAGGSSNGLGFNGTWNGVTNAIPTSFALNATTCTVN